MYKCERRLHGSCSVFFSPTLHMHIVIVVYRIFLEKWMNIVYMVYGVCNEPEMCLNFSYLLFEKWKIFQHHKLCLTSSRVYIFKYYYYLLVFIVGTYIYIYNIDICRYPHAIAKCVCRFFHHMYYTSYTLLLLFIYIPVRSETKLNSAGYMYIYVCALYKYLVGYITILNREPSKRTLSMSTLCLLHVSYRM